LILLELKNVTKAFPRRARNKSLFVKKESIKAVHQINLTIARGESIGLVGESGSGKSTLAKLITKLEPLTSGEICFRGQSIKDKRSQWLYKHIQLVFQDSSSSLFPKMTVKEILLEPLHNYYPNEKSTWEESYKKVLRLVNLDESYLSRYPHQLSGGQKQRVCIAKALIVRPELIIFDESISSLDQDSQQVIINMLDNIKKQYQLTYLIISHDLVTTRKFCDRIMVMYEGKLVETIECKNTNDIKHSYSRVLFKTLDILETNK
jgi:ABC-type dipeptide/oligopeptide/nickel transport system ATPase subunit